MTVVAARSGTLGWFAQHESRLIWRDFASMMTAGKPQRIAIAGLVCLFIGAGLHWYVSTIVGPAAAAGIVADKPTLLLISGGLLMFFSLMFSQAIESVTRAYYARADLDLLLSSPAPSSRLFAVRTSVLTLQTIALSVFIASPIINVLAFMDGWHWLGGYALLVALGGLATALAVWLTLFLFRACGPQRTRLIAQIAAAIVGAGFVIALQAFAIIGGTGISRFSLFTSSDSVAGAAETDSLLWLPARAAMGEGLPLAILFVLCALVLGATIIYSSRRFAQDVLATAGLAEKKSDSAVFTGFRRKSSIRSGLRRKEWMLLKRDPWLLSQSLQQVFYLIPPALLLWMNHGENFGMFFVIVPVIVMAAGQLAGGLAWLAISGEDAHELIVTAPVAPRTVLIAKIEAVLVVIAVVLLPFAVALVLFSGYAAFWTLLGGVLAASSAVLVQVMFRSQANRSLFRRRQVSSRAATICEAFVAILWAAVAGLALAGMWFALVPAVLVFAVLGVAWVIRPGQA